MENDRIFSGKKVIKKLDFWKKNENSLLYTKAADNRDPALTAALLSAKGTCKMDYILETRDLVKSYRDRTVVDHVNLHVRRGEIYGFVGPNGAGKSTVMKLVMHLTAPDSGESCLFGEKTGDKNFECFKRIGSIIESPCFYDQISGRENLALHCEYMGYHNHERIDEALALTGLSDTGKKTVAHYSMGMKQRLAIARAILTRPELLILDEPVNALDPGGIREMRDLFRRLNQDYGVTIFLSSHLLSEVEQIADTVGILQNGSLLAETSMRDIRKFQAEYILLETPDTAQASCLLSQSLGITDFDVISETQIGIYDKKASVEVISAALVRDGVTILGIAKNKRSLEDYFFRMTASRNEVNI